MDLVTKISYDLQSLIGSNHDKAIYSTQNHTTPLYVRNASGWARSLPLTGVSPWNQVHAHLGCGTLISPRHIIAADHFSPEGDIRLVDDDNNLVVRTLIADFKVPNSDVRVMKLDSDVPDSIGFYKILPQDWDDYLPDDGAGLPCIYTDQEEKILVADIVSLRGNYGGYGGANGSAITFQAPTDPDRLAVYESVESGDSSNPIFMWIGGELVLLATLGGGDKSMTFFRDAINSTMTSLGGGYQLTEFDLGAYQTELEAMANKYLELQHYTTGLSATMQWEVIDNDGTTLRALGTGGVTEPRTGIYQVSVDSTWAGTIHWYDGSRWASEVFGSGSGAGGNNNVTVHLSETRVS